MAKVRHTTKSLKPKPLPPVDEKLASAALGSAVILDLRQTRQSPDYPAAAEGLILLVPFEGDDSQMPYGILTKASDHKRESHVVNHMARHLEQTGKISGTTVQGEVAQLRLRHFNISLNHKKQPHPITFYGFSITEEDANQLINIPDHRRVRIDADEIGQDVVTDANPGSRGRFYLRVAELLQNKMQMHNNGKLYNHIIGNRLLPARLVPDMAVEKPGHLLQ